MATSVNPEKTNQQVLVLNGPQGCGKSTFLEGLLPKSLDGYMYSGPIDPASKDSLAHLAECMLINLDELDHLTRKKEAALKMLITQNAIRFRRPYGYFASSYRRHASFMASVNHEGILSDSSGSRRFLVHKVIRIDYNHQVDMDAVWAQAYHLYKTGFKYWFDGEDIKRIHAQNQDFEIQSPEEELLLSRFQPGAENQSGTETLTATEILRKLHEGRLPSNSTSSVIKVGQALAKQGFESVKIRGHKKWRIKALPHQSTILGTHPGG